MDLEPLTLDQIKKLPTKKLRIEELGATQEVMMDVQLIAGLAPGARISVYLRRSTSGVGSICWMR